MRRTEGGGPLCLLMAAAVGWGVAMTGCGDSTANPHEDESPPELLIFVYDRSGSVPNHKLAHAQELTAQRVMSLDHGDRIVAMELLEASLEEPQNRWAQRIPSREYENARLASDSVARVRFLRNARDYMRNFTDTTDREPLRGTDIVSTLHDVAEEVEAHPDHSATLYLFSDMLQATARLNFEVADPPTNWVRRAAEQEILPDLSGLCVVVVGARVDTRHGQAVKRFWQDYFEATGARMAPQDYSLRPVELPGRPCPESP